MRSAPFTLIALVIGCQIACAQPITGMGYGKTKHEAKQEALADLSQNIQVDIKSEFSSMKTVRGDDFNEKRSNIINLKSNLPLLGVKFDITDFKDKYFVEAKLEYNTLILYEKELRNIKKSINRNLAIEKKAQSNSEKASILEAILTDLDQFNKYRIVAQFLKSYETWELDLSAAQVKSRLNRLERKADTLEFGVKKIAKNIKQEKIFVYPPTTQDSSEITEFASAVKDKLSVYLNTVGSPKKAGYFLYGRYNKVKNGMELTYHLTDSDQNTIKTEVVNFLPEAFQGYEYRPKTVDFDRLIKNGVIVSSDLRAEIATSVGKRDLLFKRGETVRLLAKMNKPGYFYIVGHSMKNKLKYSYVVDFYEAEDNRKFIFHVNAEDTNRWIELGEFEVVEPFGVETLQMIASTKDLVDSIPDAYHDTNTLLYKIHKKPEKVLATIRGFIRKERLEKNSKEKAPITEAILVLTTMER